MYNLRADLSAIIGLALAMLSTSAFAGVGGIDSGDTAFMLVSSALVLLMTPGLAFFYGGLVKSKNVVTTFYQNYIALAVVTLLWTVCGYSLAFSAGSSFIGDFSHFMFSGVGQEAKGTIPHILFAVFQGMFAVITPILITGAVSERVNFKPMVLFIAGWSLIVYSPVCHWVWGGGWIGAMGGFDFAGGLVVHMTAGFSAIVFAKLMGQSKSFGKDPQPYNIGTVLVGTALLWFGWFGFNAGSELAADGVAAHAFATTFIGTAAAFASWTIVDTLRGKPNLIGSCVGTVAGLVAITPACGFVSIPAAILICATAGVVCNLVAGFVKNTLKIDDTLDVFACHGIGGLIGVIGTGLFASTTVNSAVTNGLLNGDSKLFTANLAGAGAVAGYSMVATFVIVKVVGLVHGLRASDADQDRGLDISQHNEVIELKAS